MQTFDKTKYLPNVNDSATLTDLRDGNTYTVKRLADGNVWMTQNLRIINTTLTPALSDVSSNFTIPASSTSGFDAADTNNAYVDNTYGGYYSYYTVSAGTGGSTMTSKGEILSSICPKGWKLPTGSSRGNYYDLKSNYNSSALLQETPGFVLSGLISNGTVSNQGVTGEYWSSTVLDTMYAYGMSLSSTSVSAPSNLYKFYGRAVRCIAR